MVICAVQQLVKCVLPELELCTSLVQQWPCSVTLAAPVEMHLAYCKILPLSELYAYLQQKVPHALCDCRSSCVS